MQTVKTIFDQLQSTNSRKEKEEILLTHKDNQDFKAVLHFLLNSYITTGISTKKIAKELNIGISVRIDTLFELLDYIQNNNTGRDVDVAVCQQFIGRLSDELGSFVSSLITKSLKVGLDAKTVNKVYMQDFIPTWEVQLGSAYDKLKLKNNEYFYLSQKLNGNRCSFADDVLTSRQGNEFTGMQHIIDELNSVELGDYFIDGELIRKNTDGVSDGENFRIGTGIISSDDADKSKIKLVIFDMFPAIQLKDKQSKDTYKIRREMLVKLQKTIADGNLQNIEIVNMVYEGTDKSQIDKWLEYAVQNDWEGLMLNKDAVYKCKRTTDLIKVKRFYTMDLPVVSCEEGTGRLQGTLGALVVDFKGNTVNVGSGFDDNTRTQLWSMRDELIDRVVEVKYKEVSKDKKTGLESLQFPIFVQLREIGKEVSYS